MANLNTRKRSAKGLIRDFVQQVVDVVMSTNICIVASLAMANTVAERNPTQVIQSLKQQC